MSDHSPAPTKPPRLILSLLVLVASLVGALVFASAFKDGTVPFGDPTLCGNPAPLDKAKAKDSDNHGSHTKAKAKPAYYDGGLWSPEHGLAPLLDAAMLLATKDRPIVCQSISFNEDTLAVIDRSPIRFEPADFAADIKPDLILSIDLAGRITSTEYEGIGPIQQYITDEKENYNSVLVVEPLPGPVADPDPDWGILNFDGDDAVTFFTPDEDDNPKEVALAVFAQLGGSVSASQDLTQLMEDLASADQKKSLNARLQLGNLNPYQVVPALERWVGAAEGESRESRVFEALMIHRGLGVHADALITEAAASENAQLRALAARTIGELADVTTDPIGKLTPLAEDDAMPVRYEALVATTAMPGRRAAGVAQLVEPYEMNDAMRSTYQGIMSDLLTYGEPVAADSKASRLRRMAMSELLNEDRGALVCAILLERTDLPDDKIDEVLGQLATANGRGPLVALLNLLEAMNPRTLASREMLLKKLVAWKTNELNAQTPRLEEIALGNGSDRLRRAAAAAMAMSSEPAEVLAALDNRPVAYEGLAWVTDQSVLQKWAGPIMQQAEKGSPVDTTVAAINAITLLPAAAITSANGSMLLGVASEAQDITLRFAAIRAVNALPASAMPPGTDELKLTSLEIRAIAGMKYDKETLTVTAGRPVELLFVNPDTMEHNLVITLPGRAQEIGVAMSADPTAAAAVGYVPQGNNAVLHHTRMLKPGESETLRFIAPTKPGTYEYVCTYPGHYVSMKGVLEVVAP